MARRKYQFKDRAEAEAAYKKADRKALELQWFAIALVEKRIRWSKKLGGAYRLATFTPNPGRAWSETYVVEEFKPSTTDQSPSYTVYDQSSFNTRIGELLRIRRGGGPDVELDGLIAGAQETFGSFDPSWSSARGIAI